MRILKHKNSEKNPQLGLSLIEVIAFIVIISIAVVAIMSLFAATISRSADPVIFRQAIAIAESLLDEINAMPFTYCDPDDANASIAVDTAACATLVEGMGPEPGEARGSVLSPFDNVNDYNGFSMAGGITDVGGNPIAGLNAYSASITVTPVAFNGIPNNEALVVSVTVNAPGINPVSLDSIRTRYAPNF